MIKAQESLYGFLYTLFAGVGSLGLYIKFSPIVNSFYPHSLSSGVKETFTVSLFSAFMALFISLFKLLIDRPKASIVFQNKQEETLYELDFKEDCEEPQFIDIGFIARFNRLQLFILKKCKAKVRIYSSPEMLMFELEKGFSGTDSDAAGINCDIIKKFYPSKKEKRLNIGLVVTSISRGDAEIKVGLELSECSKLVSWFFQNYCIFEVQDIKIKGKING